MSNDFQSLADNIISDLGIKNLYLYFNLPENIIQLIGSNTNFIGKKENYTFDELINSFYSLYYLAVDNPKDLILVIETFLKINTFEDFLILNYDLIQNKKNAKQMIENVNYKSALGYKITNQHLNKLQQYNLTKVEYSIIYLLSNDHPFASPLFDLKVSTLIQIYSQIKDKYSIYDFANFIILKGYLSISDNDKVVNLLSNFIQFIQTT